MLYIVRLDSRITSILRVSDSALRILGKCILCSIILRITTHVCSIQQGICIRMGLRDVRNSGHGFIAPWWCFLHRRSAGIEARGLLYNSVTCRSAADDATDDLSSFFRPSSGLEESRTLSPPVRTWRRIRHRQGGDFPDKASGFLLGKSIHHPPSTIGVDYT